MSETNEPIHREKSGPVRLAVWPNKNQESGEIYHTVAINRVYKNDQTNTWQRTPSMRPQDLPHIAAVVQLAQENFFDKLQAEETQASEQGPSQAGAQPSGGLDREAEARRAAVAAPPPEQTQGGQSRATGQTQ